MRGILGSRLLGLLLPIVSFLSTTPTFAGERPPQGKNCALAAPPSDAGEDINHGQVLRIYPRAKYISPGYSGCQLVFTSGPDGQWIVVLATELLDGDPVRVWFADASDPSWRACRFRKGQLVGGDADRCPAPQMLLRRSLPSGCAERLLRSNGSEWPDDCQPE